MAPVLTRLHSGLAPHSFATEVSHCPHCDEDHGFVLAPLTARRIRQAGSGTLHLRCPRHGDLIEAAVKAA